MGKSSSEKPEAPDPRVTIPLQEESNMRQFWQQLDAMRPTTSNPYGTSSWSYENDFDEQGYNTAMADWQSQYGNSSAPRAPQYDADGRLVEDLSYSPPGEAPPPPSRSQYERRQYSQASQFTPEMQEQFNTLQGLSRDLFRSYEGGSGQNIDLIQDAGGRYSQDLADAIYRRTTRLSGPQFQEQQRGLEQRLAERGFQVGNEGYNNEMDRLSRNTSEFYGDAADRAQITAAQQALQEAGFTNQARLAEWQGENQMRAQLAQLLAGRESQLMAGLTGNATQAGAPALPSLDVLGAYNQQYLGQLDSYNADQASDAAFMNSILGLGANFLMPGMGSALGLGAAGTAGLSAGANLAMMGGGQGLRF
jgi:hypothetical protein